MPNPYQPARESKVPTATKQRSWLFRVGAWLIAACASYFVGVLFASLVVKQVFPYGETIVIPLIPLMFGIPLAVAVACFTRRPLWVVSSYVVNGFAFVLLVATLEEAYPVFLGIRDEFLTLTLSGLIFSLVGFWFLFRE